MFAICRQVVAAAELYRYTCSSRGPISLRYWPLQTYVEDPDPSRAAGSVPKHDRVHPPSLSPTIKQGAHTCKKNTSEG